MKHECPICGETCECEDYWLWGDCTHCITEGENLVLSSSLED